MDVAGDFIYTASLLIHIKSKMLLPRAPAGPDDAAEDPRRELVERLLEHERFKNAAQMLQQKQMLEAATWTNPGVREFNDDAAAEPEIAADTVDLVRIFRDILDRARKRPILNVAGRLRHRRPDDPVPHPPPHHGRQARWPCAACSATPSPSARSSPCSWPCLELVRLQAILLRQDRAFSEIFIKKNTGFDAVVNEGLTNSTDEWR